MLARKKRKSGYEGHQGEGPPVKQACSFSASVFRKSLQGEDAFTAIKEFVNLCKSPDTDSVVLQYLEAGGGAQELVGLLQSDDKKNMAAVVPLFSALQYIIVKTLREAEQYRLSVEEACKHLLNHQLSTIHHMLSLKSTAKHRQIVLKLLTVMVTLSPQLARMTLSHVKISPKLWEVLVKHTKPLNKSVRTTFIHFLMAFLVDGCVSVIWPLLEIKGLLTSIIPGLLYDSANTVHLVLTTLQNRVLLNMSISKTAKLYTFNTPVVRSLLTLYDWKGPLKWKPVRKNETEEIEDLNETEDTEHEEEKKIVADTVHDFLQVLCTSHKYGIIFHDKSIGTSGRKHNELLQTVLESLERPWEHEQRAELVLKTLIACPDLMKFVLANVEPYLEPRASAKWLKAVNFVKQLVQSMNPEQVLEPYADCLTSHQIANVVHTLTVPSVLLRAIGAGILHHRQLLVRHEALNLLLVMMRQFSRFVDAIEKRNLIDDAARNSLKQNVIKQLPSAEALLSLWNMVLLPMEENEEDEGCQFDTIIPELNISTHLLAMIDLFLLYNKCFPHALDIPSSINFLTDTEQILAKEDDEAAAAVQEKVLQLLITLDSFAFTPDKEMFSDAVHRLSSLVDYPSAMIPLQARNILCTLLVNTGLFEGVLSEVFVWLHCYLAVPTDHRKSVARLLIEAIVHASQNPAMYIDFIVQSEEAVEDTKQMLDSSRLEDMFDELLEASGDEVDGEVMQEVDHASPTAAVTLSPLLPAVLETAAAVCDDDQHEGTKYFISCVVIHLLHSQTSSQTFLHLVQRWPGSLPSAVLAYISGWSSEGMPQPLKKPFGSQSPESKISKALLQPEGLSVDNILSSDVDPSLINNESSAPIPVEESTVILSKNRSCIRDPVHVLLLYKLCVFHLTQLASRGELTEKSRDKCKDALVSLLCIISKIDKNYHDESVDAPWKAVNHLFDKEHLLLHCLKHTLTHPFLLYAFTPMYRKKQVTEKLITEFILEALKLSCLSKTDMICLNGVLKPFKQKLIHHIIRRLKKNKLSCWSMESVVQFVELFELSYSDVLKLMYYVVAVPAEALMCRNVDSRTLSVWGSLLMQLLGRCINLHKPINTSMIISIANHITQLAKDNHLHCTPMEEHFLQYLEQFPHHLEHIQTRLLQCLLQQQSMSSYSVKLSVMLLSRKPVLMHDFISLVRQSKNVRQNATIVLPLLSTAFKFNTPIEQNILNKIYKEYSTEIKAAMLKPSMAAEWLKSNISAVVQLVYKCMDFDVCKDLWNKLKSKAASLDKCEDFYMELLKCLCIKMAKNQSDSEWSEIDFVLLVLEVCVSLPKENVLDQKQMETMCHALQDYVVLNEGKAGVYASIKRSAVWLSFIKVSLKFGLKPQQDVSGKLLDTLATLCDVVFENNTEEPQIAEIYQWTLSHSEFLTVMLGKTQKKSKLIKLLLLLTKKDPSVMSSSHIPIFLGSYNATLDLSDQLVLQLLQMYEAGGVSLYEYRPYLWGEAAVSHYSVKSKMGISLWRQPQTNQVLRLLEMDRISETVKNFPLSRGLYASQVATYEHMVYDPAFLLPLFSHLLAPEAVVRTHTFISSGGLAVTLAALGSTSEDTRAAACHVIARLYFHEEACRNVKGRLLGLQFLDAVRNGVASLKNKSSNPQLPCIITTFLARTSLILSQTHHAMYLPLQNFIIAKSSLNLNTVPEFFTFFHSSEVEFRMYRLWILQIIRDGMKSDLDFQISQRCAVFKLLLSFYSSILADDDTKKLILEVIESTVNIPTSAELLVSTNGLISWLHHTIGHLSQSDTVLVSVAIGVLSALQTVLLKSPELKNGSRVKKKSPVIHHLPHHILLLLLDLLPKLGSKLAVSDLRKYLQTMQAVLSFENTKATCSLISKQKMFEIVQRSKEVFGSVSDCEDLLVYGCKFALATRGEGSKLSGLGTNNEQAFCHLRDIIVQWLQRMYNSQAAV